MTMGRHRNTPSLEAALWSDLMSPEEVRLAGPRPVGNLSSRTALLVVDLFAQAFGTGPLTCEPAASNTLPVISALVRGARRRSIPVVHTTGEDRLEARPREATTMVHERRDAAALAADYAFHPRLRPAEGEFVIYKSAASAFFETRLRTVLHGLDVERLVVVGESTSGCIRATAVDAFSSGYDVIMPHDAVFDRNSTSHRVNLFDIHMKYGSVVAASDVLAYWPTKASR